MPYLTVQNIQMYYEIAGTGEPLLFLHGLGSSTLDWEYQIDFFKQYYQVIAVDLRGHGNSDKPTAAYSVSLFAQDIAQCIQALSITPAHIVGHSLGGMIAFQLAIDYPEAVKTLCIINSGPEVVFTSTFFKWSFYLRKLLVQGFGVRALSASLAKKVYPDPEQIALHQKFIERWSKNDKHAYINSLGVFPGWTVKQRLSEIQCPTLILASDQDYSSVAYKQSYTQLIPNAQLVVIPHSRHVSIQDQPAAINTALFDFLRSKS